MLLYRLMCVPALCAVLVLTAFSQQAVDEIRVNIIPEDPFLPILSAVLIMFVFALSKLCKVKKSFIFDL